jgi:peptidoglycan/LPS O-acetylase OafA/YrhL/lysophospholipase L1-like esterase
VLAKFRYDINALRAIAVVSVLLFHLRISLFSGGFIGVDIFFVISGYLMTKIILLGIQNNNFSVWDFYSKRVKRIIPALLILVLSVTIAGFFIYLPGQYKENEANGFSSLLFFSNILYWRNSSYFASAADNNVFLHTWSLSVEWQFYLIYPLLLLLLSKLFGNKTKFVIVFIIAFLVSVLIFFIEDYRSQMASFFLLPTRTWELMAGGLAFIFADKIKSRVLLVLSYVSIILTIIFINDKVLWPGPLTIIPIVATFFIIVINHDDNILFKNTAVQTIGKVSYSIYLWHWPIIVFSRYLGYDLNLATDLFVVISSVTIAFFSFRYIESAKFQKTGGILGITAGLAAFALLFSNTDSNSWLFKRKTLEIESYIKIHKKDFDRQLGLGDCFIDGSSDISRFQGQLRTSCLAIDTNRKNVLLIGDSHAAALSKSLTKAFESRNVNLITATASGQHPVIGKIFTPVNAFDYIYFDYLLKNKRHISKIILEGNWFTAQTETVDMITKTIDYLKKQNIPVVVIGQNNIFTIPFPAIMAKWNESRVDNVNLYINKEAYQYNQLYKAKLKPYYVDIYYYSNIPKLDGNYEPFIVDEDHLSAFGSDLVVKKIFKDTVFQKRILNDL